MSSLIRAKIDRRTSQIFSIWSLMVAENSALLSTVPTCPDASKIGCVPEVNAGTDTVSSLC